MFPTVILFILISLIFIILTKNYSTVAQACNFFTFRSADYSSNYLNTYLFDSFLFHENSHFAMMLTSIFFFYIYEIKNFKNLILIILILILFLFYTSLTLITGILVGAILAIFINLFSYKNRKIFIYSIIITIVTSTLLFNNNNCVGRFDYLSEKLKQDYQINKMHNDKNSRISDREMRLKNEQNYNYLLDVRNLSSQVYNIAILNTIRTATERPIGWGFNSYYKAFNAYIDENMKKFFEVETNIQVKDKVHELKTLNIADARSTLLKILCEFGIFSLIFIFYGFRFLFNHNVSFQIKITISTLLTTQLITGAGYFNGGFSIFLFLMIILGEYKSNLKY